MLEGDCLCISHSASKASICERGICLFTSPYKSDLVIVGKKSPWSEMLILWKTHKSILLFSQRHVFSGLAVFIDFIIILFPMTELWFGKSAITMIQYVAYFNIKEHKQSWNTLFLLFCKSKTEKDKEQQRRYWTLPLAYTFPVCAFILFLASISQMKSFESSAVLCLLQALPVLFLQYVELLHLTKCVSLCSVCVLRLGCDK